MKKVLLIAIFQIITFFSKTQSQNIYYILKDNVKVYTDTLMNYEPNFNFNMGVTFLDPVCKTKNWVGFYMDYENDTFYINTKNISTKNKFFNIAKNKKNKNGSTKYELMKIYLEKNDYRNAEPLAFDLMNNHKEILETHHETCDLLNTNAFDLITKDFPNNITKNYPDKIIKTVKDSNIIALAHIVGIRNSLLTNNPKKGMKYIKDLINIHIKNLLLEGCEYSVYSSTYPIIDSKSMIFAFYSLVDRNISYNLKELIEERAKNGNELQKAFCNDLLKALQGDFWKEHFEFKGR